MPGLSDACSEAGIPMRRWLVVLGLVLLLGAVGSISYRWFQEPARYARQQTNGSGGWRGVSEPRGGGWRDNRSERSSERGGKGGGLSGLRLLEIVVDLLNIVVGIAGIWLAVIGVRMQRAGRRQTPVRPEA
jgi:hypothetical protein